MPVGLLYCEGVPQSLDARLLKLILGGAGPKVEPKGSKWGMAHRIRALRDVGTAAYGLLDGDYSADERPTAAAPSIWTDGDRHLGWRWRRKEVENYLLDPVVVERAMALHPPKRRPFDAAAYRGALDAARVELGVGQAARIALDLSRPPRTPSLSNAVDEVDDAADLDAWRALLTARVDTYLAGCAVEVGDVLARFDRLRAECAPGGWRHRDALVYFAGKDLGRALRHLDPALNDLPTRVLRAIERVAPADLADWLPEWRALADAVAAIP